MQKYIEIFLGSYSGYWNFLKHEIVNPGWHNYFYWFIGLFMSIWLLEILFPWRKKQSIIRKDFWLDSFYMFFNYFLFPIIVFVAISNVFAELFNDFLALFDVTNTVAVEIASWPAWSQILTMFIITDFLQWNVHRYLHKIPWLWELHKLHHSVKEMGFAAHLRYHWMENVVYKTVLYLPMAMIGFGIRDFFVVHIVSLAVGNLNHANVGLDYGPLKYILNNPRMHIWHHAKKLPDKYPYGMNFGITLSLWDYLFKTACIPENGRDIELGFDRDETYPGDLAHQLIYPLGQRKKRTKNEK